MNTTPTHHPTTTFQYIQVRKKERTFTWVILFATFSSSFSPPKRAYVPQESYAMGVWAHSAPKRDSLTSFLHLVLSPHAKVWERKEGYVLLKGEEGKHSYFPFLHLSLSLSLSFQLYGTAMYPSSLGEEALKPHARHQLQCAQLALSLSLSLSPPQN